MTAAREPLPQGLDAVLPPEAPWPVLGRMTDDELQAIWLYLRSVPSKPFGNK